MKKSTPVAKRRSRLGCNGCKKLKAKCDELKPTCSRCEKRGISCIYSFEMVFQNQKLAENKKKLIIKDRELLTVDQKTDKNDEYINVFPIKKKNKNKLKISDNIDDPNNDTQVVNENDNESDKKEEETIINTNVDQNTVSSFIHKSEIPLLPLPENLLDHPYYNDAFNFFVHFTSHFIVCAKPKLYKDNPMHVLIPQYAKKNNCLMDLLVAHALTHRSLVLFDENFSLELIETLTSRGLYRLFTNFNLKSEISCITALFLCIQKIFSGNQIERYKEIIDLARHSFHKYIENDEKVVKLSNGKYLISEENNPLSYFLINWIGYLEIIGIMMAISPKDFKMPYRPNPVFTNYQLESKSKIDLFLGFDVNFIIIFDKLIPILNMVEEDENQDQKTVSTEILSKAIEWEFEFNTAYKSFKSSKKIENDPTESDHLLNVVNEVFYYSGIIHLYRRVYKIPRSNSIVQKMVGKVYKYFKNDIESASNTENCAVFPLFVAACESIDGIHRDFFYERFNIQFLGGNAPAGDVLKILKDTWNTGDSWINSVKRVRKETGFFLI